MCFPINCLRNVSFVGAFLITIIGLGILGGSIYGLIATHVDLTDLNDLKNTFLLPILIFSIVVSFGGLIGCIGIKKGYAISLFIFSIVVIVFIVAFGTIGIVSYFIPKIALQGNCTQQANFNSWIGDINSVYNYANVLCNNTYSCDMNTDQLLKYTSDQSSILKSNYNNLTGGTNDNFQQIASAIDPNYSTDQIYFVFLKQLEGFFKCTAWCPTSNPSIDLLFYKFLGVNSGIPQNYCYQKLLDQLTLYGKIICYTCIGFTGFLLIVALFNTCLCCHPNKKGNKGYRRFSFDDDDQRTGYYRRN